MRLERLIEALSDAAAYPARPESVSMLQTHVSVLFFAGDLVYKVKKPVDLGFLDFSTPEKRRHFCEEEVRLNAALAPGVYLRVAPIARDGSGRVRIDGEGETVEHAVEMRRLPADRMLDAVLERAAGIGEGTIEETVRTLAEFHGACETGPGIDEHASPEAVGGRIFENLDRIAGSVRDGNLGVEPGPLLVHIRAWVEREIGARRELMVRRQREGRVREGHGDLHAGNICLAPGGLVIYDRIEFSRALRSCDVSAELAFLAMDLDLHGQRSAADAICERYAERTGDAELLALQPLYRVHYAIVRGMVDGIRAGEDEVGADGRDEAGRSSLRHLALAAGYTAEPMLIAMCGLSATGKSHVARALGLATGWSVLRSDAIRKELFGMDETEHWRGGQHEGPYTPEWTERTYGAMLERAAELLRAGRGVILDATFPTGERRESAAAIAGEHGARFAIVYTMVDESVVRERMAARAEDGAEISDADLRVYERARAAFDPPGAPAIGDLVVAVRTDGLVERAVVEALGRILGGPGREAGAIG